MEDTKEKHDFILKAVERASFEEEEGHWYATVQDLPGVLAQGNTKEECRVELFSVIEGWIEVHLNRGLPIPTYDIP
jgi:predicted RNase H-like HicB family nuclease